MKLHKTTQAEFLRFKKQFLKTRRQLGLITYGVVFLLRKLDCLASIKINSANKFCEVSLASEIHLDDPETSLDFEAHAIHECCHLFLQPLCDLAESRYLGLSDIEEKSEEMVRVLEDVLCLAPKEKL